MQPGTRIAHYEVLGVIGRGGMGEVYRARDSKLKRDVALKTLSAEFAADAERVARLEREATVIAALNHPHIGAIHGIEDHDGGKVLVLELVDGQTLADRLRRAPLRIEPALRTALQIASAIESAHDRGVIHRDLKPDNIAFTRDGHVKVLDFGLAKSVAPAERNQTTATVAHTELGTTSGTAPYMSPEQARGEPTDRQTDIWAFGVTLYEMLTGISPFERKSSTETLARVLEAEPDWAQLPAATPPSARRLLRRCLEKDRKRRFRDMADVRIEIEDALAALGTEPAAAPRGAGGLRAVAAAAVGVALLALVGFGTWSLMRAPAGAPAQVVRLSIPGMERPIAFPFGTQDLAISPNGSQIALAGQARINLRRLSDSKVSNIEIIQPNPFFSPDGAWLGAGNVARVPVTGGTPSWIFENTERPAGAAWGSDGTIVSATTSGLYRVDANGGEQQLLAQPRTELGELLYAWPQLLPGGTGVLFTIVMRGSIDGAQIAWLDLRTLETRVVLTGGTSPRYTRTGHLVYAAGQRLWAFPFDPVTGTTSGEPVEIPDVAVSTRADNGAALFAIADNGTLAFVEPEAQRQESRRVLVWVDREGTEQRLSAQALQYNYARVSPDGSRIALDISGANRDIWIWDVSRESLTRLSDGPNEDLLPLWSRDGRRVYFGSARNGNVDIFSQAADASTRARMELEDPRFHLPQSISADGRYLIVGQDQRDLSVFDLAQSQLEPLLQSDAKEWVSDLSPNGRWLAYDSDESGQFEVYLRPFPNVSEGREVVSIGGGGYPQWDPSGSGELYYIDADGAMMAVQVGEGPPQPIGKPAKLFQFAPRVAFGASARPYDVGKDGRFLLVRTDTSELPEPVTVTVILNWFESLRAQVPIAAR
jgi:Tol biopolymer transport system component